VRILPLSDKYLDYAKRTESRFRSAGFRVSIDQHSAKVNAKIRQAQLDLIPYMVVVGPKEEESDSVSLRDRIDGDLGVISTDEAIMKLRDEIDEKIIRQSFETEFSGIEADSDVENEY